MAENNIVKEVRLSLLTTNQAPPRMFLWIITITRLSPGAGSAGELKHRLQAHRPCVGETRFG